MKITISENYFIYKIVGASIVLNVSHVQLCCQY